jgi:hypothetical protein
MKVDGAEWLRAIARNFLGGRVKRWDKVCRLMGTHFSWRVVEMALKLDRVGRQNLLWQNCFKFNVIRRESLKKPEGKCHRNFFRLPARSNGRMRLCQEEHCFEYWIKGKKQGWGERGRAYQLRRRSPTWDILEPERLNTIFIIFYFLKSAIYLIKIEILADWYLHKRAIFFNGSLNFFRSRRQD